MHDTQEVCSLVVEVFPHITSVDMAGAQPWEEDPEGNKQCHQTNPGLLLLELAKRMQKHILEIWSKARIV